ncbi:MlaA family lipoprotein [Sphingomonas sp. TDK1]|uniref:MlaA family lipoprotein n=1 Tax=Sphingomonas sp. TDK1 TaxID=453247 RepID=UPI0018DB41AF|nr:VacJ family lipoprotein [Sphingomonas sp. TDK1]
MLGTAIGAMVFVPPVAPALAAAVTTPVIVAPAPVDAAEEQEHEIVVSGRHHGTPGDPLEKVNALSFSLTQHLDDAVTGPASRSYAKVVPKPIRSGLRNFFTNLREPVVAVNYLLQLKPGKAVETVGRFAINTTLGIAGTVDVAKRCPFNLPLRQNRFSDTLGFYGVKPGPFLYVPVAGPTTVRDVVGGMVDFFASPFVLGGPFRSRPYVIGSAVVRILDRRDQKEEILQTVRDSEDPYAVRRDLYLQRQRARVEALRDAPPPHSCRRKAMAAG